MNHKIAIIGAGFGGIAAARALKQIGENDFCILEAQTDLGGVWLQNRYPGCAADMPAYLFCYRDRPFTSTTRTTPTRGEVLDYLKEVSAEAGLARHLKFDCRIQEATWDDAAVDWRLRSHDGKSIRARFVIIATGTSGTVNHPKIQGLETFSGPVIHTVNWDSGLRVEGRNIAIIGSGASAVQLLPRLARDAISVILFQRTARWILPKPDWKIGGLYRTLANRHAWYSRHMGRLLEAYVDRRAREVLSFRRERWKRSDERLRRLMSRTIKDTELQTYAMPQAPFGCSRTLFSNEYFPALRRTNVRLVPSDVKKVEESTIIDAAGGQHDADVLVLATGYRRFERLLDIRVPGRRPLYEAWTDEPAALLGMLPGGVPNLIHMSGPNSGVLNAAPRVLEIQAKFAARLIARACTTRKQARFMATDASVATFADSLKSRLAQTIWSSAHCNAWYTAGSANNPVIWPGSLADYRATVEAFDIQTLVAT